MLTMPQNSGPTGDDRNDCMNDPLRNNALDVSCFIRFALSHIHCTSIHSITNPYCRYHDITTCTSSLGNSSSNIQHLYTIWNLQELKLACTHVGVGHALGLLLHLGVELLLFAFLLYPPDRPLRFDRLLSSFLLFF